MKLLIRELIEYLIKVEFAIFDCGHIIFEDSFYQDLEDNPDTNLKWLIITIKEFIASHHSQKEKNILVSSLTDIKQGKSQGHTKSIKKNSKGDDKLKLFILQLEEACIGLVNKNKIDPLLEINQTNLYKVMKDEFNYTVGLQAMNQRINRNEFAIKILVTNQEIVIPNLLKYIPPINSWEVQSVN